MWICLLAEPAFLRSAAGCPISFLISCAIASMPPWCPYADCLCSGHGWRTACPVRRLPTVRELSSSEIAPLRFCSMVLQSSGRCQATPYGDVADVGVIVVSGPIVNGPAYCALVLRKRGYQLLDVAFLVTLPGRPAGVTETLLAILQARPRTSAP